MEFYVLDNNLNKIAVVDDYISAIWCKRYYEVGGFDLEIEASKENIALFQKGYFLKRNDDDMICRIEAIEIDTRGDKANTMLVGGIDCKSILSQRIIADTINFSGTFNNYIKRIVNENIISPVMIARKIPNFQYVDNTAMSDRIVQRVSYDNVCEKIISLCKSYLYGWKVYLENGIFKIKLYKGNNLGLVFSPENENLYSSKYSLDSTEVKNVALVGGEGEGKDRVLVWFGNQSGLNRYELFVDESESSDGMPDMEYLAKLKSKGGEEISKENEKIEFEGEIDTTNNTYKVDFDLGDVLKIQNEYGISSNARITEVVETWDGDGYTIQPKLEYLEFQPISPEIELKQKLIHSETLSSTSITQTYSAVDHPYGITIELYGAKGQDGQDGQLAKPLIFSNQDGTGVALGASAGGAGGAGGIGAKVSLYVDGKYYRAFAQGGSGGGGGGTGVIGKSLKDDSQATYMQAGVGGKGANGDVITIHVSFSIDLRIVYVATGHGGSGTKGGSCDLNIMHNFSLSSGAKGGNAWNNQSGEKGTTIQSGKGADATPPDDSLCEFPVHMISNTSELSAPEIKVYTWNNINT